MLNHEDYRAILRVLESKLREADPYAAAVVNRAINLDDIDSAQSADLKSVVLRYLDVLMEVLGQGSAEVSRRILELANQYIRTEHGGSIEALTLQLSSLESELYQVESVDLGRLPDLGEFLAELRSLRDDIEKDDLGEGSLR